MTDFVPYEPGTIEVTNGSKNIVGTGTDFSVYSGGDTIWVDGYPVLLDGDPSSDTAALAKYNYLGTSGSGKSYRWVPLGDLSRAIALDTRLSSYFTSGNLSAEAGLAGAADVISYYTGVGTKAVTAFTAAARTVLDDTTVAAMLATLLNTTLGATDNRLLRSNGTGGGAAQNSAITVDDSGNVSGVGDLTATGSVKISGANQAQLTLDQSGSPTANRFRLFVGTGGGIYTADDNYVQSNNTDLHFLSGAGATTDQFVIRNTGVLDILRGQLAMPASQNASAGANTWDDYEEGTFTPVIEGSSAAGAGTYSVQQGRYTKNGNIVSPGTYLAWSAHTGTGNMKVASLPFTVGLFTPTSFLISNITYPNPVFTQYDQSATTISFFSSASGGAAASLAIDTAGAVLTGGSYRV